MYFLKWTKRGGGPGELTLGRAGQAISERKLMIEAGMSAVRVEDENQHIFSQAELTTLAEAESHI